MKGEEGRDKKASYIWKGREMKEGWKEGRKEGRKEGICTK